MLAFFVEEAELSASAPRLSVVIPLLDEHESLAELHEELRQAMTEAALDYELILVDDGSTDGSWAEVRGIVERDPRAQGIRFRRNLGKAAALEAGFRAARGELVATLDADLQDDPAEIPALLAALEAQQLDLVVGWKYPRLDPAGKRWPSRLFNFVATRTGKVRLHDMNCGLKLMRAPVVRGLRLYGEQHRYLPVLAAWRGFRVGECKVRHRPRRHGRSKYGRQRFLRGFFDLLTVLFLTRYGKRPMHLLGGVALLMLLAGLGILIYLTVWWFGGGRLSDRPLLFLGLLLVLVAGQTVSFGLLAEMVTHQGHTGDLEPYVAERATSHTRAESHGSKVDPSLVDP
jgi:glycosyltransferase involved in cell wall biosynthesis